MDIEGGIEMSRIVVVRTKDGSVSCLPVSEGRAHYERYFEIVCYCNKLWNPYHVNRIKAYFSKRRCLDENVKTKQ